MASQGYRKVRPRTVGDLPSSFVQDCVGFVQAIQQRTG